MASSTGSTSNILGPNGTSNFMSGLASGLDTEDMVEKLLSGTQAKIDKQNAKKQQVEWKQEIYRDMITKINGFQDKYFSFFGTGNTNLLSSSFYNVMTAASTSSAVKVTSATSSAPSNMVINSIKQLARSYKAETADNHAVTKALEGKTNLSAFNDENKEYSFDVMLDGVRKSIKFKGSTDKNSVINNINASLKKVFGNTVEAEFNNSSEIFNFKFNGETSNTVTSHRIVINTSSSGTDDSVVTEDVLKNLGLSNGVTNKLNYNTYLKDGPFATALQGRVFEFSINGTEIKVSADDTVGDVINRINNSEAGVKVTYSSLDDKFIIQSANTGKISGIDITQTKGNLLTAMFGIASGNGPEGDGLGGSTAGLRSTDTLVGDAVEKDLFEAGLNVLKSHNGVFSLNVNGKNYSVEVEAKESGYSGGDEFAIALNEALKDKFGVDDAGNNNIEVKYNSNGSDVTFDLISKAGYQVSFSKENVDKSMAGQMGFKEGQTQTKIDEDTTLGMLIEDKDFIDGTAAIKVSGASTGISIYIDKDTTIKDLADQLKTALEAENGAANAVNVAFDEETGTFSITGIREPIKITAEGKGKDALKALFGTDEIAFNQKPGGKIKEIEKGQNAILTVNGTTIERNTNTFELDGITMELTATTAAGDPPISLTTSKDTDKIVEGLKGFVDDYNALIEELNKQVNAEASYQKYPPLTDAQKKEMSEREIEKWEEKSKEGLLRYDSNITKFLQDMRSVMYKTVESAGLALYDIGIESSSNYRDNGKLVLDESKLKSALTTNLDGIQKLFTDKENGIAVQLQSTIKAAANPSSGSPGSLVRYAGTKDVMVTSNSLYYELKSISEALSRLNTKYETERTRYWKQFTSMEQAISKMNSQSSWLTQQFS